MLTTNRNYVRVAKLSDVKTKGYLVTKIERQTIALFYHQDKIYAIDNRCPHMGFPLDKGSVDNCILTCHWHHARFDLNTGGTFDLWADDVRSFPVEIRDGEVWIDIKSHNDATTHAKQRLIDGIEQNISLVIAKSVLALLDRGVDRQEIFQTGLDFGVRYQKEGWGAGLTIHTAMMNIFPYLNDRDRARSLYHGIAAVSRECAGKPPRFAVQPLPNAENTDISLLQNWFRQFVEVRDSQGAERCLVSAIEMGADRAKIAEMLFTAVTDHRYIDAGHPLDFTNKALEALDAVNWKDAEIVLTSLVRGYTKADRMEESNSWRYPIDLVKILEKAFAELDTVLETGKDKRGSWDKEDELVTVLLGEDPSAIATELLNALGDGATEEQLSGTVVYAAALRVAQFNTNNDFRDWDTAHHSFTFANGVDRAIARVPSKLLLRGVFDAAMTVYLNRFLNVPPVRLPNPEKTVSDPEELLKQLPELLNQQQQVNETGKLVAKYLYSDGDPDKLLAMLGHLLLREDRDFHTIQEIEAAFRQYSRFKHKNAGIHFLVAAARYLAAHSPTRRTQEQTYQMAERLHQGEEVFVD
ncbi:MAG: Rieske (2Fe-2S) protein [Prochloraceae cyanobacterium]